MEVTLVFGPTRTRNYTRTLLDFVNDMYVRMTTPVAVCTSDEAVQELGQELLNKLQRDAPKKEIPMQLTMEYAAYWRHFEDHLNDAVDARTVTLVDEPTGLPSKVYVVLRKSFYRAWGGKYYDVYEPNGEECVFVDKSAAEAMASRSSDYVMVELPLIGTMAEMAA